MTDRHVPSYGEILTRSRLADRRSRRRRARRRQRRAVVTLALLALVIYAVLQTYL